jgi:uncharacterized protein (DUF4415 family)
MSANATSTALGSGDPPDELADDDLPDLSTSYWQERIAKASVRRGRPKGSATKVSTTIRLDPDVLDAFKAGGPGWQGRVNAALRKAAGLS